MGRPRLVTGGKRRTVLLDQDEIDAVEAFKVARGASSWNAALRLALRRFFKLPAHRR